MFVAPGLAQAQYNDRSVEAVYTGEPPVIDGSLDEGAWETAHVITDFHQVQPDEYEPPSEPTEVRVLFDSDYLYVGARVHYSDMADLTANIMTPQQRVYQEDRIYLMLDPFMSRRNGYLFEANANGIQGDALIESNTRRISEWTGVFQAETSRDENGWSVEFRIPFSTISFNPDRSDWGFNVYRDIKRTGERLAWSSTGRQELVEAPSAGGTLTGLRGLKQGVGVDLVPSVALNSRKDYVMGVETHSFEPSLDLTYRFTPSLTGKLTFNTDFSATEVDDRQVNLTRFSLFFPEKRDFFLQDAGIFEFGGIGGNGQPFFSRTIGLGEDGEPLNLNYGAKVTGRAGRWNLGFLGAQQESGEVLGKQNLFVGRAVANLFDESSIGFIFTDGDPAHERDAQTVGVDFLYRDSQFTGDRILQVEAWYQETDNGAVAGETGPGNDNSAWSVRLNLPNDRHRIDTWVWQLGRDFEPAMGFANRTGIREKFFSYRFRHRPEDSYFRTHDIQVAVQRTDSTIDEEKSHVFQVTPWSADTTASDEFRLSITRERELLTEGFDLFGKIYIPPGDYEFTRYSLSLNSAWYRPLEAGLRIAVGDFLNGTRETISAELNWKPLPRFHVSLDYSTNKVNMPGGKFTARVMSFKSQLAFNSRWSFIPLFQFDNVSEELGINLRLRYHPSRGSDMYVVWSRNMLRDLDDRFHSQFQETAVKATYIFRF
jgi:hypothetical protein